MSSMPFDTATMLLDLPIDAVIFRDDLYPRINRRHDRGRPAQAEPLVANWVWEMAAAGAHHSERRGCSQRGGRYSVIITS
jgi:hypothetical protein